VRIAVAVAILAACGGARPARVPAQPIGAIGVQTTRFPHELHTGDRPEIRTWRGRGVACADCHDPQAVREGRLARPGLDQHAPCDDCHKAEFGKPPGKLCAVCHASVDPFQKGNSPLQDYPRHDPFESLASNFSHRIHVDVSGLACRECHEPDPKTRDPRVPGHKACVRCHEAQPAVKQVVAMERCDQCHPQRDVAFERCRTYVTAELVFHHATHERDVRGNPVRCESCHDAAAASTSRDDMQVPAMERCAQCHEDARKTPDDVRMQRCATCHLEIDETTPPRSADLRPACD
jgi:predicted CXXCH cytochrome family protein